MSNIRWHDRAAPVPDTVALLAFGGWGDAGRAATTALARFRSAEDDRLIAEIDADDFYDFTQERPMVSNGPGLQRDIAWPDTTVHCNDVAERRVITVCGPEPHLHWRAYSDAVLELCRESGVKTAVLLGALLADVPHTRPVHLITSSQDEDLIENFALAPSQYEGPTGIVGVLAHDLQAAGIAVASLWAAVPTYVPSIDSPKAALALLETAATIVGGNPSVDDLRAEAERYEHRITELIANDDETVSYVARLEEEADAAPRRDPDTLMPNDDHEDTAHGLIADLEQFLRDHGD